MAMDFCHGFGGFVVFDFARAGILAAAIVGEYFDACGIDRVPGVADLFSGQGTSELANQRRKY
jgi:hypothetical protein